MSENNSEEGAALPVAGPGAETEGAVQGVPDPKFDWMGLSNQWGVRVKPGEHAVCGSAT